MNARGLWVALGLLSRNHPCRIMRRQRAYRIKTRQFFGGKRNVARATIIGELLLPFYSDNDAGDRRAGKEPGECYLADRYRTRLCDNPHFGDALPGQVAVDGREIKGAAARRRTRAAAPERSSGVACCGGKGVHAREVKQK